MRKAILVLALLLALPGYMFAGGSGEAAEGDGAEVAETEIIRFGNFYSQDTTYGRAIDKFKADVEAASGGEIEVQVFHGGSLGGEQDHIQAVKDGSLEMMQTGTAGIGLFVPETAVFELWFNFRSLQQLRSAFESVQSDLDEVYQERGFKLVGAYYDGPRNILSTVKFETLDGLRGLKFRVPGSPLYVSMANALGAQAVSLPYTDVYTGLQTGAIDAMEGTPDSVLQQKFYEQADYYILDRHVFQPLSIVYNIGAWNSLSEEHKDIVSNAVQESSEFHLGLVEQANNDAISELESNGIEIVEVQDIENWQEAVREANQDFAEDQGELGELIYDAMVEAME